MSPRAFRTMLVGPMGTKDRLELESRVLAAALKQSVELGDSAGVSLAHKQIFLHIRSAHGANAAKSAKQKPAQAGSDSATSESTEKPKLKITKNRKLPNIVWTEAEEEEPDTKADESTYDSDEIEPSDETMEIPISAKENIDAIQEKAIKASSVTQEEASAKTESAKPVDTVSSKKTEDIDIEKSKAIEGLESRRESSPANESEDGIFDAYGILGIEQVASFEQIHVAFLVSVRKLLFTLKKTRKRKQKKLLAFLQELWIAHDVLTDPVTRTDYDFRILGLRGAPDVIIDTPENEGQVVIGSTVPLRIGELLQCCGLLEPTELEIAADMHKAMPEMLFGSFLVKQGFITEQDLEQVLMGQRLLKMGYMSVATFRGAMKQWIDSEIPIYESSVADGLLTVSEMERIIAQGLRDTDTEIPAFQGAGQVGIRSSGRGKIQAVGSGPMINQEEAAKRNVNANNAVPEWKDQLDWSAPPEEEVKKVKKTRKPRRTTIDTSVYQIEGVTTDEDKSNPQRRSLRSLMKGMHLDEGDEEEEETENNPSVFDFGGSGESGSDAPVDEQAVINQMKQTYGNVIQVNSQGQAVKAVEEASNTSVDNLASSAPKDEEDTEETLESDSSATIEQPEQEAEEKEPEEKTQSEEQFENKYDEDEEIRDDLTGHDEDRENSSEMSANEFDEEDDPVYEFNDANTEDESSSADAETFTNLDKVPDGNLELNQSSDVMASAHAETGDNYDAVIDEETAKAVSELSESMGETTNSLDEQNPEEAARQALKKSIEWQVMYKIKGNLADVLLSDSEEPDVPSLAPKLEDIDVIPKGYSGSEDDKQSDSDSDD